MNQFILRPLVFFGAVFYSLDVLPGIYQTLSLLNPMVYMTTANPLDVIYTIGGVIPVSVGSNPGVHCELSAV
jgi:hypothetical protein